MIGIVVESLFQSFDTAAVNKRDSDSLQAALTLIVMTLGFVC